MSDFEEVDDETPVLYDAEGNVTDVPRVSTAGQQQGAGVTEAGQSHGQQEGEAATVHPGSEEVLPSAFYGSLGDAIAYDEDSSIYNDDTTEDSDYLTWLVGLPIMATIMDFFATSRDRFSQFSPLGFEIMHAVVDIALFFIVGIFMITMSIVGNSVSIASNVFTRVSRTLGRSLLQAARITFRVIIALSNLWQRMRNQASSVADNVAGRVFDVLRERFPRCVQRIEEVLPVLSEVFLALRELASAMVGSMADRVYEGVLLRVVRICKSFRDRLRRAFAEEKELRPSQLRSRM